MSDNQWGPPGQYPQQPPPPGPYQPPGQYPQGQPQQPYGQPQYGAPQGGQPPYGQAPHGRPPQPPYGGPGQVPPPGPLAPQPWQTQTHYTARPPMQQLPHGMGWGAPPPGGPQRPRKKSKAIWFIAPLIVVAVAFVGLRIVSIVVKGNGPDDYSSPTIPTSTYSPSTDPSADPSVGASPDKPTVAPTTRPPAPKPTVTKPTAPRTTTPPVRRGPTDYEIVSRNRIYAAGVMPGVGCRESNARPSSAAGARANYAQLRACLTRAWTSMIQRSGAGFRPPTVVTFTGVVQSPCGSMSDSGPPFYCSTNETIYMNLREDVGNYNRYSQSYSKVWARMWMLHQFAHEYGHHVQHLTGILAANHDMRYEAPTRTAELEMTRRLELQASCFSDVFIGANRRTYPITGQSLTQWRWLIGNVTDNNNDHGDAPNHRYWATRGYNSRNPAACNTFTAPSARVR